jgi:hypothetical protein
MRLLRIVLLVGLFGVAAGMIREPARACNACQDQCDSDHSSCLNEAYNNYQSCMNACDELYPWWSGCQNYCYDTRLSDESTCESNYTYCYDSCPP